MFKSDKVGRPITHAIVHNRSDILTKLLTYMQSKMSKIVSEICRRWCIDCLNYFFYLLINITYSYNLPFLFLWLLSIKVLKYTCSNMVYSTTTEGGSGGQRPFVKEILDIGQLAVGRFYFLIALKSCTSFLENSCREKVRPIVILNNTKLFIITH